MGIKEENKNGDFVQFYRQNMKAVSDLAYKNPTALKLFMFICEHMDGYNALMASQQVFMDYLDSSRATVARAIKILKDEGFVDVFKSGTSNVYIINPDIAWTSYGNQKHYCKFTGNVLVSAEENKDWFYRSQKHNKFKKLDAPEEPKQMEIEDYPEVIPSVQLQEQKQEEQPKSKPKKKYLYAKFKEEKAKGLR